MRFKYSLLYLILSILFIISTSIFFIGYYLYQGTLRESLENREAAKAQDVNYNINKIINGRIIDMMQVSNIIRDDPKLINSLRQYELHGDVEQLKKSVDKLYLNLVRMEIDFCIVTDKQGKIGYQATPSHYPIDHQAGGLEEALSGEDIVTAGFGPGGWAIRTLTPLFREAKQCGVLILGIHLNDGFARKIAEATRTQISFSTPYRMLASSWPPAARRKVSPE
jgi:sensor histidine kinase regulating citrate/malate metabolism